MKPKVFVYFDWNPPIADRDVSVSFTLDRGIGIPNRYDDSYFKVHLQFEPPCIDSTTADMLVAYHEYYDLILAWNKKVLDNCPNAVYFPIAACTWLDNRNWFSAADRSHNPAIESYVPRSPVEKQYAASFLTSTKGGTDGQRLRLAIYDRLPLAIGDLKIVKNMPEPRIINKQDYMDPYQFVIDAENSSVTNYFCEKIIDPFIAKAIPLYWGCPNISDFFNMDGVILYSDPDDLITKLAQLTPGTYRSKLAAVEDNYQRALKYVNIWERIENEITKGIERKQHRNG